jgi:prevent-host-death family protein
MGICLDRLDGKEAFIMPREWQLQEAKNRFSEVVDKAAREGPQVVTRRGKPAAIILSPDGYRRLVQPKENLVRFFQRSPLAGMDLDVERSRETGRDVEL